jgi:hypothetical protein
VLNNRKKQETGQSKYTGQRKSCQCNQIQVTDTTERNKKQDKVNTLDKENHANVTKYK